MIGSRYIETVEDVRTALAKRRESSKLVNANGGGTLTAAFASHLLYTAKLYFVETW